MRHAWCSKASVSTRFCIERLKYCTSIFHSTYTTQLLYEYVRAACTLCKVQFLILHKHFIHCSIMHVRRQQCDRRKKNISFFEWLFWKHFSSRVYCINKCTVLHSIIYISCLKIIFFLAAFQEYWKWCSLYWKSKKDYKSWNLLCACVCTFWKVEMINCI